MGKSDPYVEVTVGDQKAKTKVQKKDLNPEWGECFEFEIDSDDSDDFTAIK